jgi:hypothetical protein
MVKSGLTLIRRARKWLKSAVAALDEANFRGEKIFS